ncbi:MAG TPA: 3'-5' exonuclease [Thiobacillaceae bacterium]|nr:3'-5' exonuclease [Thiobacillaceae bacterium]
MAILIPALSSCVSRMTAGERRLAQRLEAKLEDDYLIWYDVPVGPGNLHPDFILLHPRRGLLILEVKDWKADHIRQMDRDGADLFTDDGLKRLANPLEQARHYAHAVVQLLEKDAQLTFSDGSLKGRLMFPWSYGVVFTHLSRQVFEQGGLGEVIEPHRALCQDEMTESVEAEALQRRLWEMFPLRFSGYLTLPQLDRIRWHLFPEIRLPAARAGQFDEADTNSLPRSEADLFADEPADLIRVLDLQQEQLARSLGEGHRVIHGVAGSGKTLILGYRAEHLARICTRPVLILCYNKALARRLEHWMQAKGVADRVHVGNFHAWCHRQLTAYHVGLPRGDASHPGYFDQLVERVLAAVEGGLIPGGQYDAVLIDEGHDFRPEWLMLVVRMVTPASNSLLVLYDDVQSIYDTGKRRNFSFKSVGIQAQGRTTVLKVNYRNTREILDFAARFIAEHHSPALLDAAAADEDGVPRLAPVSAGRHGPEPQLIRLPTLQEQGRHLVGYLKQAHRTGTAWRDMAVLYRHWESTGKPVNGILRAAGIPLTWKDNVRFDARQDTVKLLPFHSSKGLEFPLVAIAGVAPAALRGDEQEARLLYVAMTRATENLLLLA